MVNIKGVKAAPASSLLTPEDSVVVLVDYQPQMFFAVTNTDRGQIINAAVALARSAKVFDIPVILTTVAAETFSGPMLAELAQIHPRSRPIDRTAMNFWEDARVVDAVKATGRSRIVIAGLVTEVCVALPALSAAEQGYAVYVPTDACGGVSWETHENAVRRMQQRGIVPTSWLATLLEWQRDWSRSRTYDGVMEIVEKHAGAYGQGVVYARTMIHHPAVA